MQQLLRSRFTVGLLSCVWIALGPSTVGLGQDSDVKNEEGVTYAITNVAVVDVVAGEVVADQLVLIKGDRIQFIGDHDAGTVPESAKRIDGREHFIVPGLWDMHIHWYDKPSMRLFTTNGVTGVRVMFGGPEHRAWREEFGSGASLGPRMVVAGPIVDGPEPIWAGSIEAGSVEEGRAAVVRTKDLGADFVKVYSKLPADVYREIAKEASRQQFPFAGHVPSAISPLEASELGQHTIEHMTGIAHHCADPEKLIDSPTPSTLPSEEVWNAFDDQRAEELFDSFKQNETWQCPTLVVLRNIAHLHDPRFREDDRLELVPPNIRAMWNPENDFRFRGRTEEQFTAMARSYERSLTLVGKMNRAGVPLIAGTDTGNPFCYPGSSLLEELQLLVAAGLSPAEAIRTATLNPARCLGLADQLGTVEQGKLADLVLLTANPLEDIANLKRIHGVFQNGAYVDREQLDTIDAELRDRW